MWYSLLYESPEDIYICNIYIIITIIITMLGLYQAY